MEYFLAIDIGASSGRHILAHYDEKGCLQIEEVYRFSTRLIDDGDGHCHWDIDKLFSDVKEGLKKAAELGKIPSRIGIDTFGVDYALLDEQDKLIGNVVSYRDVRGEMGRNEFLDPEKIFTLTGCQPQSFDTCYQLYMDKKSGKLQKASSFMFLGCYLAFLLTGKKSNELSIASTSGLIDSRTADFSGEVLSSLGLKADFFPPIRGAGTCVGPLTETIAKEVGYSSTVYSSYIHDTGSAFYGSGAKEGELLISSGTWSLVGAFIKRPVINLESFYSSLTNEMNQPYEIRFLKNVMGMWLINSVLKEEKKSVSVIEAVKEARAHQDYKGTFDATDNSLLNPESMKEAVLALLKKNGHPTPKCLGELYFAIYHSLALAYAKTADEISCLIDESFTGVRIFGGGVQNELLNELTEKATGLPVRRGPVEATAIGNILAISK